MRTLSKLKHEQFKDPGRSEDIKQAERTLVHGQERVVWRKRGRLALRMVLIGVLVHLVTTFGFAWGRTADGHVVMVAVDVTAPADVRIVAVHHGVGDRVRAGDALVALEPIHDPGRALHEARVETARHRLELVRAGGSLGDANPDRRLERLRDAERELARTEREWQQARVTAKGLERTLDLTAAVLRQDRARLAGAASILAEQVAEAEFNLRAAAARTREAERNAENRRQLGPQGAVPGRDVDEAVALRDASRADLAASNAALDGLRRAHAAAAREHLIDTERAAAALDELDARVAGAWLREGRLEQEAREWQATVNEYRSALPEVLVDAKQLWRMEVELARAELASAEAALSDRDARAGRMVVTAAQAGVIDRLPGTVGSLVPAGGLVVAYSDPALRVVEAYVEEDLALRLESQLADAPPGTVRAPGCRIACEAGGVEMAGAVLSVGRRAHVLPDDLNIEQGLRPDLYRIVRIRPADPTRLTARMRVALVFDEER